jgi:hypothetical protein
MKNFEMTPEQLNTLMTACKPVAAIALQCGTPSTPQENANRAWQALGDEMGFDHMTVTPNCKGDRFFSANEVEKKCEGIDLGDGNFSGCDQSAGDCPECGK